MTLTLHGIGVSLVEGRRIEVVSKIEGLVGWVVTRLDSLLSWAYMHIVRAYQSARRAAPPARNEKSKRGRVLGYNPQRAPRTISIHMYAEGARHGTVGFAACSMQPHQPGSSLAICLASSSFASVLLPSSAGNTVLFLGCVSSSSGLFHEFFFSLCHFCLLPSF